MDSEDKTSKEFLRLLGNLNEDEWKIKVSDEWTIKDVVSHLIGWERECTQILDKIWGTKEKPWFLTVDNFDEFNKKSIKEYKNYPPKKLIGEWKYWQGLLNKKIEEIGEDNLRAEQELFGWVFDEGEDSHYSEHFSQIKKALE